MPFRREIGVVEQETVIDPVARDARASRHLPPRDRTFYSAGRNRSGIDCHRHRSARRLAEEEGRVTALISVEAGADAVGRVNTLLDTVVAGIAVVIEEVAGVEFDVLAILVREFRAVQVIVRDGRDAGDRFDHRLHMLIRFGEGQ